jgi:hypothetical protein
MASTGPGTPCGHIVASSVESESRIFLTWPSVTCLDIVRNTTYTAWWTSTRWVSASL